MEVGGRYVAVFMTTSRFDVTYSSVFFFFIHELGVFHVIYFALDFFYLIVGESKLDFISYHAFWLACGKRTSSAHVIDEFDICP